MEPVSIPAAIRYVKQYRSQALRVTHPENAAAVDPSGDVLTKTIQDIFGRQALNSFNGSASTAEGVMSTALIMHLVSTLDYHDFVRVDCLAAVYREISTHFIRLGQAQASSKGAAFTHDDFLVAMTRIAHYLLERNELRICTGKLKELLLFPKHSNEDSWWPQPWWLRFEGIHTPYYLNQQHRADRYEQHFDSLVEYSLLNKDLSPTLNRLVTEINEHVQIGFLHDSFTQHFAAFGVRYYVYPNLPMGDPCKDWYLEVVRRFLIAPSVWAEVAHFLGGMLSIQALRHLCVEALLERSIQQKPPQHWPSLILNCLGSA